MKRRTARKKALQALFQIDLAEALPEEAINHVLDGNEHDPFLNKLVLGTVEHQNEIDELIKRNLTNWKLERLANIDRAILRLAVYEMKYEPDIPFNVTIDEAIELAKMFGDVQSSKFVNGVLSSIKEELEKKA
ncbi:MAG: transcription antitermination factor NusB [Bacillaceae bacterium]|jgi:N utilization substance protein B|uniref:Transcription antitermination protein NusB n=2 Tax=Aeribacillus TaxID=1055323 RepID=A0A165XSH9_9BACI|nr:MULTISPECIES: transcription antitermination factor NusB [Aeribacillus]AXI40104.1 transcription antitermination factor NusB [Bacillaceae bacterium ZC4]REJ18545.1 MAG: transcription antitermination factor NusB [Bacillaceae bacterium]ASS91861.1 N utilization substance protein B [Aeribacillus pallidus]KZM56836.1 N utilization substance protein B [Aeribacillus pallidus]KZN96366.1 N utilization substance protein B [Aeribacillus pallidus]